MRVNELEGAMYDVTEFYIQPPSGNAIKFADPAQAQAEAARLGAIRGPVLLFSVKGTPRYNLWDEPRLIGCFGAGGQKSENDPAGGAV